MSRTRTIAFAVAALVLVLGLHPARAAEPPRVDVAPDNNTREDGTIHHTDISGGPMAGPGAAGGAALGEDAATTLCAKEASTPACDVTTIVFAPTNVPADGSYWDTRSGVLRFRIEWEDASGGSDLDVYVFRKAYPGEVDEEGEPVTDDVFVISSAKDNTELGQPGPAKFEELNIPEPVPNEYYVYIVSFNGTVARFTGLVELNTGLVRTFDRTSVTARQRTPSESGPSSKPLGGASESDFISVTPGGTIIRTAIGREVAQQNPNAVFVGKAEELRLRGASVRRAPEPSQTTPTVIAIALALFLVGGMTFLFIRRYRRPLPV